MATVTPTIEVHGSSVLVSWLGLSAGDVGAEVDVSQFNTISTQNDVALQMCNDPANQPWIGVVPSGWSGGASSSQGKITDRFRFIRPNTNGSTSGDVTLWCVNL